MPDTETDSGGQRQATPVQPGRVPENDRSHVCGDRRQELLNDTVAGLLRRTVARFPEREAVVFTALQERWTWQQFHDRVDSLAAGLLATGLQPGDRIGIWSPNRPEWLLAQFATARIGLVLVNINPAYRLSELEFALNKVACTALVTAEQFKDSDYTGMLQALAPELATCQPGALQATRLPHLRTVIKTGTTEVPGMYTFNNILNLAGNVDKARLDALTDAQHVNDVVNIQFTSGTTGLPKGASLTHHNIVNNARFVTDALRFSQTDRLCIPVPFYHCFGMVMGTLGCVSQGAAMIIPGEGFDPQATLRALSAENCTALYGVPTMFVAMLDHPSFAQSDLQPLRTGIMAGAPCPIEIMKRVQSTMNMREITIAYGMTETSPVSFQSGVSDSLAMRVSSVGQVHPHVEVKLIDPEGAIVPVGEQGELCTRGYSVMQGYWDDPQRTGECIDSDGWMHTGDLATLNAEGYCNITGRVKDMIVRGGENIYPREIEEYLYQMEAVAQVQVFGIPDERYGESVCAWIVPREGFELSVQEIRGFCEGQIAYYKIPAVLRIVEAMPMTVTGKAQKFLMRQAMIDELGLQEVATA